MGTTPPSQDRAPAWLPTAEIPLQRQASPTRIVPIAVPKPRGRRPRPVATYAIAAGLAVGTVGVIAAVQAVTVPSPAASGGYVANVSVPGRVLTSFGDGTWQIGVDVEPGTYTTAGAVDATCSHALRRTRTSAATDAVNGGAATVVLTVADGWFDTSGCATWKRAG